MHFTLHFFGKYVYKLSLWALSALNWYCTVPKHKRLSQENLVCRLQTGDEDVDEEMKCIQTQTTDTALILPDTNSVLSNLMKNNNRI